MKEETHNDLIDNVCKVWEESRSYKSSNWLKLHQQMLYRSENLIPHSSKLKKKKPDESSYQVIWLNESLW
jgi:hypothetical protein